MKNLKEIKLMMERLESPRLTDTEYQGRVKQLKESPIKRDIGSHDEFIDAGRGTKWSPAMTDTNSGSEDFYNMYTEKFGPFTVFISDENKIKIACMENGDCYDQTNRMMSREEAAQMLGVESLDVIGD